jgi:hypothetical protein
MHRVKGSGGRDGRGGRDVRRKREKKGRGSLKRA